MKETYLYTYAYIYNAYFRVCLFVRCESETTAYVALKSGGVSVVYYKLLNISLFSFHQSNKYILSPVSCSVPKNLQIFLDPFTKMHVM
jgi:hypothetical protein